MKLYKILRKIVQTKQNVDLKKMCSIKIGGTAPYVCYPKKISQLKKLINLLHAIKVKYLIVGNGTNIVFRDGIFKPVLISTEKLNKVTIKDTHVFSNAGVGLFKLNYILQKNNLGGLEWSYGIPGSVGGAVVMNAGAFGDEIANHIQYVLVLENGNIKKYNKNKCNFSYRNSIFKNSNIIVLRVRFKLKQETCESINNKQLQYLKRRHTTQPYNFPSAGSIFLKSNNESAGKIIDKLGLSGVKIGGIQISKKHANFFVNIGNAKSKDLEDMILYVKQKAKEIGIDLKEEILFY